MHGKILNGNWYIPKKTRFDQQDHDHHCEAICLKKVCYMNISYNDLYNQRRMAQACLYFRMDNGVTIGVNFENVDHALHEMNELCGHMK